MSIAWPTPSLKPLTAVDLVEKFGPIPLARICHYKRPGEATEEDVLWLNGHGDKLVDYFASGAQLVWMVDPIEQTLIAHRSPAPGELYRAADRVPGDPVLRGFVLDLAELFVDPLAG